MDNENIRIEFVNGSSVASRYAETSVFHHMDIRDSSLTEFRRGEWPAVRGYRADLVYDEFADFYRLDDCSEQFIDMFNSVQTGYTVSADDIYGAFNRWWNETGQYEFSVDRSKITIKQKEAPDFGELPPSQELNDFINTLAQGE